MRRRPNAEAPRRVLQEGVAQELPERAVVPGALGQVALGQLGRHGAQLEGGHADSMKSVASRWRWAAGAAREELVLLHPLEEEMGVVGPGEPDAAVQLNVVAGDPHTGVRRVARGHGRGLFPLGRLRVRGPGRELEAGPRHLDLLEHLDEPVTHRLVGGDRLVEDDPLRRVGDGLGQGPVRRADGLRRQPDGDVVLHPLPQAQLVARRAQRNDRRVVEHEPGQLARGVERRDQGRPRATRGDTTAPPPRCGPPR